MGLFKYLDSITPKIYILSLGNEITIAKIGYTKKEIEKRIRDYKFSGQWKGREGEIKIHAIFIQGENIGPVRGPHLGQPEY